MKSMRIATLIARILLGAQFTAAGLGGLIFAFNAPPAPPGLAGTFQSVFFQSHFVLFVAAVQLGAGVLLLLNRYVTLALVALGAVIANILVFHITMAPLGIFPGLIATVLWFIVAVPLRSHFQPLLEARTE
jgi:putative oxidoreductase